MVVGEPSGDALGASLIGALREQGADLTIEGILGPELLKQGGTTYFPMERLSVMGLIEPLRRIPELYRIRRSLVQHFLKDPPDVFIGVDAPDFNLGLERILRRHAIKIVHYVSPTVWAWRRNRIHTIKNSVHLMLTLFPFEHQFYESHHVPVCFTGHPFADEIPLEINTDVSKEALGFSKRQTVIAVMPGSRDNELRYLAEQFLLTAKQCYQQRKDLMFVVPLINEKHKALFQERQRSVASEIPLKIVVGNARLVIAACDVALVASGTATLEVMLHKKPMVVAYRMHPLTYQIARYLVKVPYIALPNLLAEERLALEFIQDEVQPLNMSHAVLALLEPGPRTSHIIKRFHEIHQQLRLGASQTAAGAIRDLMR